uniref:Uncharacterized protein n=1 Tax=Triticum urartu TaxID=4572 RepID=A0A8R7Q8F7_TRIUA
LVPTHVHVPVAVAVAVPRPVHPAHLHRLHVHRVHLRPAAPVPRREERHAALLAEPPQPHRLQAHELRVQRPPPLLPPRHAAVPHRVGVDDHVGAHRVGLALQHAQPPVRHQPQQPVHLAAEG